MSVSKPHTCGFNADFLITRARCIEDVGETRQPIRPCLLVIRDFRGDGRQANVACRLSVNANRHKLQQSSRVCVTVIIMLVELMVNSVKMSRRHGMAEMSIVL